jgi:hypothetical protein
VKGSATAPELQAIVGRDVLLDFTKPDHRRDVTPTPMSAWRHG